MSDAAEGEGATEEPVTSLGEFTAERGDPGHRHEDEADADLAGPDITDENAPHRSPSTSTSESAHQHEELARHEP